MKREKFYYVMGYTNVIGQLASEMLWLRNIYPVEKYDVTVVTYPLEKVPGTNRAVFDIFLRPFNHVTAENARINYSTSEINRRVRISDAAGDDATLIAAHAKQLKYECMNKFCRGSYDYYYSLNEDDINEGLQLRHKFGIPDEAPVVTLHVREGSTKRSLGYHTYRDANIEKYYDAIEYLVERGYYVVRLGDNSMKHLPDISPQVIDAPFHPAYSGMAEPYFIASSKFYLGMPSGPYSIAFAFDIPILSTNDTITTDSWGNNRDIYLPKKHYSKKLNRCLCYEEVTCSPLTEYFYSSKFEEAGIDLIENTSQEILAAVKEMDQRLEGRYEALDEANYNRKKLKDIDRKAHIYRQTMEFNPPFWGMHLSNASVSNEFLRMNPYFLSRDYGVGNHYVRPLAVSQEEEKYYFGPVI